MMTDVRFIFAISESMSPKEMTELLDLSQKLLGNPWHIQGASALNGDGIEEAVCELAKMVKQHIKEHGR